MIALQGSMIGMSEHRGGRRAASSEALRQS
jgi:hypothetical protein